MFDTDKFIQCIEEHPALWEKSCKEYSDRNLKEKSWFTIGENMFDDWKESTDAERQEKVKEMKNKWRHIRDNFGKYVNQGASGDPAPRKKKKYVYANALSFLLQSIAKRRTSGNILHEEEDDDDRNGSQETEEIDYRQAATSDGPNNENGSAIKKPLLKPRPRARKTAACTSFQAQLLQKLDISQNIEEDADRTFLLSVLPSVKKLNEDEKLDFRFHTLQFFRNLREKNRQQSFEQPRLPFSMCNNNYPQPSLYLATSYPCQATPLPSPSPSFSQQSVPSTSNESSVHSNLSEYLNLNSV